MTCTVRTKLFLVFHFTVTEKCNQCPEMNFQRDKMGTQIICVDLLCSVLKC